jgi:hypothetical protein
VVKDNPAGPQSILPIQKGNCIFSISFVYADLASLDPVGESVARASLNVSITILSGEFKQGTIFAGHTLACRDLWWRSKGFVSCGFDSTIRIWDLRKESNRSISTNFLRHSVCGLDFEPNRIFMAHSDQFFWIDKRRSAPIAISAGTQTPAVTCHQNLLLSEGYRRSLHEGRVAELDLSGGPISSVSIILPFRLTIEVQLYDAAHWLDIGASIEQRSLPMEEPSRFGYRSDISDRRLMFAGAIGAVCGVRLGMFYDRKMNRERQLLENMSGFQYGACFIPNISQRGLKHHISQSLPSMELVFS